MIEVAIMALQNVARIVGIVLTGQFLFSVEDDIYMTFLYLFIFIWLIYAFVRFLKSLEGRR